MIYARLATLNLPSRNTFFTGRKAILETLDREFSSDTKKTQTVALYGLSGIGKTQIALEYAHYRSRLYDAILWVNASSRRTFEADMQVIAQQLRLPGLQEKEMQISIAAVQGWLRQRERWLLILDNVTDEQLLRSFIPAIDHGHVLITTQLQTLSDIQGIEIEKMTDSEGVLLLLRRARVIPPNSGDEENLSVSYPDALKINEIMNGLPLALNQAAAFIEETCCSLSDYLMLFEHQSMELLKWQIGTNDAPDLSLSARLSLSLGIIEKERFALDVLHFCALLKANDIPEELILQGLHFFNEKASADSPVLVAAIDVLCKYSFLQRSKRSLPDQSLTVLSIHPLMQEVLNADRSPEEQRHDAECAVLAVSQLFPPIEFNNWAKCQIYLPHVEICIDYIEKYSIASQEAAHLIHEAAYYLFERVMYDTVEELYDKALTIQKTVLAEEDSEVARTLHSLALYYRELGRYDQAEKLFQDALRIREKVLGAEDILTAASMQQLGWIYNRCARYGEAEEKLQRSLQIRLKTLPDEQQGIATVLNELGRLYRHIALYPKAEQLLKDALAIRMKLAHPHFAKTQVDLAWLYFEQGDLKKAEEPLKQALLVQEQALSPNHPRIAKTLTKLGLLSCAQGKFKEAEEFQQRAFEIRQDILPPEHPDIAESYDSLGLLCYHKARAYELKKRLEQAQAKYREAESYYQKALMIREKLFGSDHPETTQTKNHLGLLYLAQSEYEQARKFFVEALTAREATLGRLHPHVITNLNYLAQLSIVQGDYTSAEEQLLKARSIGNELSIDHPQIARTLVNLADLYALLERFDEAEALYDQALPVYQQILVPNHPDTLEILKKRATLLQRKGDDDGALELKQPLETLIEVLKERASHLRSKGESDKAIEIEQRLDSLI